mmetsp:Transcript_119806/g.189658  ORF Transcript_119806/g.189658 Transcript_119806/m.189658 type:complete len:525 (-) Transcript_119806:93-1667(-)
MKIMWQGTVCFLCFLLQFQCGSSALKYGAAKKNPLVADTILSTQSLQKPPSSDASAGSRRLQHLIALKAWQRATRTGLRCPKPQPCDCHCDCLETVATGSSPKPPVACAMLPSIGTPAPSQPTTTSAPPPALPPKPKECKMGEVAMSDGACVPLTTKVLETIGDAVNQKKEALENLLQEYATLHQPKCVSCPGAVEYFNVRAKLLQAHQQYAIVLRFFMDAMHTFEAMERERKQGWEHGDHDEPEFVLGVKKLRAHCEPWTVNGSRAPDRELCGVVCRNQPSCMGFAMDASSGWCLWFDDAQPQSEAVCSSQTETEYIRRWQPKLNATVWATMKKLQIFDTAIITALEVADVKTGRTSAAYANWSEFDGKNATLKNLNKEHFQDMLDNYTGTLFDLTDLRKEYLVLQRTALEMTMREAKAKPPFPMPSMNIDKEKIAPIRIGFAAPTQEPPKLVTWDRFPNSEDSSWAKLHPDCPQGVPCVCDCKCRGPPPQNFVEPPPVPTTPCPQFPQAVPNPFMFSVAGGR